MRLTCTLAAFTAAFAFCAHAGEDFPLDLSKAANMGFKDDVAGDGKGGWSDQGPENDFAAFDVSRKDYEGMVFSVLDPARNGGKAVLTFDSQHARTGLKDASLDLSKDRPNVRFLYLLHTSCWNQEPTGSSLGSVEVLFEDGTGIRREVKNGIDISDWWDASDGQNSLVVAKKPNKSAVVGVFLSKFELAAGDKQVKSLTFKSNGQAVWIMLGATLSSREISNEPQKTIFSANAEWKTVDMEAVQVKAGSALDLSALLEPGPAGKHGRFLVGAAGALAFEDSPNVPRRLLGFNGLFNTIRKFDVGSKARSHALIENYAKLCRRQGYDLVRPLAIEMFLMEGATEECVFNPVKLDIVDKLIAELKAQGVYTYLTIGAYRLGLKERWPLDKSTVLMAKMYLGDKQIRDNWRSVAEKMMSHVNPYTGVAWKDDAAIACVEFYNEQDGAIAWPASQEVLALAAPKWSEWLLAKYKTPEAMSEAWGEKVASFSGVEPPAKFSDISIKNNDYGLFWRDLGREELDWCAGIIRGAGYKGLVSQFNASKLISDGALRWEASPVVSMNTYYAHPSMFSNPGSRCRQESNVGTAASSWRDGNATRLTGRPMFITEHNHAFWNPYQHENGLLFAAYSAFQGFSAIIVHEDAVAWEVKEANRDFSIARSPIGRANEFLSAFLFRRGDVKQAVHGVELQIPEKTVRENCDGNKAVNTEQSKIALMTGFSSVYLDLRKDPAPQVSTRKPDLAIVPVGGAQLEGSGWFSSVKTSNAASFSLASFAARLKKQGILSDTNVSDPEKGVFQGDTGEITLRSKENLLKVVTPRTEGVSLEADRAEKLSCLDIKGSSVPAAIASCSVDGKELATSSRIVLVYATEVANSGMELSEDRVTMRKLGDLPVLMRCGKLGATLKNSNATQMSLYALGMDGTRKEKLPLNAEKDTLKIKLDTASLKNGPTTFFELVAE